MRSRALVTLLCLFGGCASPVRSGADRPILIGQAAAVRSLDPARVSDFESIEVVEQIYEGLVGARAGTDGSAEIAPALATAWERSADGRVFTFELRRDVRFHDGTALDADAVVFSFERQRDPNHPFHRHDFIYWNTYFRHIRAVEAVESHTVRITLERPYAPFLADLAMFPVAIVSPTAVRKWNAEFARHPVGTGPFRFVEWTPGERVMLSANAGYWQGTARLPRVGFITFGDAQQRLIALEGGAIDIAENLDPEELQFVALHPELRLARIGADNVAYLAMNTTHPPFDDVRVRRAVNYAINKDAIVKLIYQGLARGATTPVPPTMWSHAEQPGYRYDRLAARRLLAAAGFSSGRWRPRLYVMKTARPYLPAPERVAHIVQQNLHDVGIEVEVVVHDFDTHIRKVQGGEHDLCLFGWSADSIDPHNILQILFDSHNTEVGSARNVAFFRNPALDALLLEAQESLDRAERQRYYDEAQRLIVEAAPWVPLAHGDIVVAARAPLGALRFHSSATLDLK